MPRRLHSLHFLGLFALLLLCWHLNLMSLGDDTYTGMMLAWYVAAGLFLVSKYRNGELSYYGENR